MRKCNRSLRRWTALLAATTAISLPVLVLADTPIVQFTPGDLLIMRGGDAANSNGIDGADYGGEVNAYIDEYSQAGYYVGTLPLSAITLPGAGVSSHEGNLDISPNGQWIAFAGYDPTNYNNGTVPSTIGPNPHDATGLANALVGDVNLTAGPSSLNVSTPIPGSADFPNSLTGQFVHSAMTLDGNEFFVGGKYNETAGGKLQANDTGLIYINGSGASATDTVLEGGTDWRNVLVFNGQLYGSTGSSSVGTHGVYTIGNGIPTTPIPAHTEITNYPGGQSSSSLAFADITTSDASAGTNNGFNVLYTIGDQSASGIVKYSYDSATGVWNHTGNQTTLTNGNNIVNPYDIVATVDPTNSAWVDITVSGENGVYSYIDKSGDPETPIAPNLFTLSITPPSYASFYGMTQVPNLTTSIAPVNLVWANGSSAQTWDVGTTSNWTYGGNNVQFANSENVTFDDSSTNKLPISLNSVVQPNSVTVNASKNNYTISGSGSIGGTGVLRLLPGNSSTFTLDTVNTYSGGTIIDGGTLVVGVNGALPKGNVTIAAGGNLTLVSNTGTTTIQSLNIAAGGTVDLMNNSLLIQYGSAAKDPVLTIRADLKTAYAAKYATAGLPISSSLAAKNPGLFAIGYSDNTTTDQLKIMVTVPGDTNLSGSTDFTDLTTVAQFFGQSIAKGNIVSWQTGDVNYDGNVDFNDLTLVAQYFGDSLTKAEAASLPASFVAQYNLARAEIASGAASSVPEPSSLLLIGISAASLLNRRGRRQSA